MDEKLLSQAEVISRELLESHFKGRASFPEISAQRKTGMDDSQFVQVTVVFDGKPEIIDDPLWYDHDWHAEVDDLFEEGCLVTYKLDKTTYTKEDREYLDRRVAELREQMLCRASNP